MQSKGAIRFVAILLLLASLWQLSFTLVTNRQEKNAEKYAEANDRSSRSFIENNEMGFNPLRASTEQQSLK